MIFTLRNSIHTISFLSYLVFPQLINTAEPFFCFQCFFSLLLAYQCFFLLFSSSRKLLNVFPSFACLWPCFVSLLTWFLLLYPLSIFLILSGLSLGPTFCLCHVYSYGFRCHTYVGNFCIYVSRPDLSYMFPDSNICLHFDIFSWISHRLFKNYTFISLYIPYQNCFSPSLLCGEKVTTNLKV